MAFHFISSLFFHFPFTIYLLIEDKCNRATIVLTTTCIFHGTWIFLFQFVLFFRAISFCNGQRLLYQRFEKENTASILIQHCPVGQLIFQYHHKFHQQIPLYHFVCQHSISLKRGSAVKLQRLIASQYFHISVSYLFFPMSFRFVGFRAICHVFVCLLTKHDLFVLSPQVHTSTIVYMLPAG